MLLAKKDKSGVRGRNIGNVTGRSIKQLEMDFNRTVPSEKWSDKHLDKRDYVITKIIGKWNKDKIAFPMPS